MKPGVSIIVPVYKSESYISKCIESILRQTYKSFQLILIDDGSPDDAGAICDRYAAEDARILVIHQENQGVSNARKNGFLAAEADYIAFIDSDDYIDGDYLEKLMTAAIRDQADMVCCNSVDEGDVGQVHRTLTKEERITDFDRLISFHLQEMRFAYVLWAKVIRKEIMKDVHFIAMKYTEDTHMILECFSKCHVVSLIPYSGYHYVVQPDSAMATSNLKERYLCNLVTIQYLCEICREKKSQYLAEAKKKLLEKLFITITIHCKEEGQGQSLLENISIYYRWFNLKMFFSNTKGMTVWAYGKSEFLVEKLLRFYFRTLRGKR